MSGVVQTRGRGTRQDDAPGSRHGSLWRRFRRATRGPRNAVLAVLILGVGRAFALLPVAVALALGRSIGSAAHALLAGARRLALEHMAIAFPEMSLDERRRLVRETFRNAGTSFSELLVFPKLTRREGYVDADFAALAAALEGGRGAIGVTGHTGNWELLAAWTAHVGIPLTVVVRVNDLRLHGLILRFRQAAGIEVLVRDDPRFLSAVREALRRNRVVALLIDQDTRGAGVFVPFFGRLARTPPGAALLALRSGAPLVTVFIDRRAGGGHTIRSAPVDSGASGARPDIVGLTARLTAAIEAQIRRAPAEWVWWHERWRSRPPATPGPRVASLPRQAAPS